MPMQNSDNIVKSIDSLDNLSKKNLKDFTIKVLLKEDFLNKTLNESIIMFNDTFSKYGTKFWVSSRRNEISLAIKSLKKLKIKVKNINATSVNNKKKYILNIKKSFIDLIRYFLQEGSTNVGGYLVNRSANTIFLFEFITKYLPNLNIDKWGTDDFNKFRNLYVESLQELLEIEVKENNCSMNLSNIDINTNKGNVLKDLIVTDYISKNLKNSNKSDNTSELGSNKSSKQNDYYSNFNLSINNINRTILDLNLDKFSRFHAYKIKEIYLKFLKKNYDHIRRLKYRNEFLQKLPLSNSSNQLAPLRFGLSEEQFNFAKNIIESKVKEIEALNLMEYLTKRYAKSIVEGRLNNNVSVREDSQNNDSYVYNRKNRKFRESKYDKTSNLVNINSNKASKKYDKKFKSNLSKICESIVAEKNIKIKQISDLISNMYKPVLDFTNYYTMYLRKELGSSDASKSITDSIKTWALTSSCSIEANKDDEISNPIKKLVME